MGRDVQLSAFPDLRADRPTGPLIGSIIDGDNSDLLAAVAPLYLSGSVLDVTYGRGGWWRRFTPDPFTWHDLELDGIDFRALPEGDRSIDAVCFDPPYVPANGHATTTTAPNYRARYGLDDRRPPADLEALLSAGLAECCRVARRWVLAKCTDYTDGRGFHLGHVRMIGAAYRLGWVCHDLIVHASGSGPSRPIETQLRARRQHSYLLVFGRGRWPNPTFSYSDEIPGGVTPPG